MSDPFEVYISILRAIGSEADEWAIGTPEERLLRSVSDAVAEWDRETAPWEGPMQAP